MGMRTEKKWSVISRQYPVLERSLSLLTFMVMQSLYADRG